MNSDDLKIKNNSTRCYVEFYIDGKRIREYTGKNLNLDIEPNRAKSEEKKLELLHELKIELLKHINSNNYPAAKIGKEVTVQYSVEEALTLALEAKLKMNLSKQYKDNLLLVCQQFLDYLEFDKKQLSFGLLKIADLEYFLSKFNSSGTYYMKKRNDLSILFSTASKLTGVKSIARDTHTERSNAKLHKAYNEKSLRSLLDYLFENDKSLHLCCLLTYGCWLRPHVEVLSLTKSSFRNEYREIHLSGNQNKSGRIRIVYVPDYVRLHLIPFVEQLEDNVNIFTLTEQKLNKYFFTTKWKRLRQKLLSKNLIEQDQTIYSFRHTAAVQIYKRKKDIYLLQKLMGHGSIGVTQKYLRSLGQVNIDELIDGAPTL